MNKCINIIIVIIVFLNCILPTILCIDINNNEIKIKSETPQITVSGISSGGYMAVQFHVAFSSMVRGAAIIAGGPYWCAKGSVITAQADCMKLPDLISITELIDATEFAATTLTIDDTSNMKNSLVWLYSGMNDTVVFPGVMKKLVEYYENYIDSDNIKTVFNIQSEHAFITNSYGNNCTYLGPDYINNCNYNAPLEFLSLFYDNNLNAPSETYSSENIITVNQSSFIPFGYTTITAGLNNIAYAYIPTACKSDKSLCTIHVAFHGCLQTTADIGDNFYTKTGYNEIAETNKIIILYPQAIETEVNPKGCFDWWSYTGEDYASQMGVQMETIKSMILSLLN